MNTEVYKPRVTTSFFSSFIAQVYGWMTIGLLVSFAVSFALYFAIGNNPKILPLLYIIMLVSIIVEIILVIAISGFIQRLNIVVAGILFIVYSGLTGITLGVITSYYSLGSIATTFLAAVLTFGVMSFVGFVIKRDLTKLGGLLTFGLIGLILGSLVNLVLYFIFPQLATGVSWVLTYVGLALFMVMIAYDTQKLKTMAAFAEQKGIPASGIAIQGALSLYLDFINIFIRLLSIFGKRR